MRIKSLIAFAALFGALAGPAVAQEASPPRLVVVVVVDQFSANLFNQ